MYGIQKIVAKKIKVARAIAELTQSDLAKILNYDRQIIMRMESGKRKIDIEELKKIADATGQSLSFFHGEDIKPEQKPRNKALDVSDLTDNQIEAIQKLIDSFRSGGSRPLKNEKRGVG